SFGVNAANDQDQQQAKYRHYSSSKATGSDATPNPPKTKRLTHEKRLIRDLLNNYP
ncbi:unnamed protein product, partial [Rotaria magnacalcarata]